MPLSALAALFTETNALPAVVVNDEVPVTVRAPPLVIAPTDEIVRFPVPPEPIDDAPRLVAMLLVRLALLLPVVVSDTAPVSALAPFVNVMLFAPAPKLEVPATVSAPVCVSAPCDVTVSAPVALAGPSTVAMLFVRLTLAPVRATAPVSALVAVVRVMLLAPALRLDVPATVSAPVWVSAPDAVTWRVPP